MGSGKEPYRTQADLNGPAFQCSCPSRKFPCKHSLGLLLLLVGNPARVSEAAPPDWVSDWTAKRNTTAEKKAVEAGAETVPPDAETAAKRTAEREKRAALCLTFAAINQPLDISSVAGTAIEADLVFYPSALPLRALVRHRIW